MDYTDSTDFNYVGGGNLFAERPESDVVSSMQLNEKERDVAKKVLLATAPVAVGFGISFASRRLSPPINRRIVPQLVKIGQKVTKQPITGRVVAHPIVKNGAKTAQKIQNTVSNAMHKYKVDPHSFGGTVGTIIAQTYVDGKNVHTQKDIDHALIAADAEICAIAHGMEEEWNAHKESFDPQWEEMREKITSLSSKEAQEELLDLERRALEALQECRQKIDKALSNMTTPISLVYKEKTALDAAKQHATNLSIQTTFATTGLIAHGCLNALPSLQSLGVMGRSLDIAHKIAGNTLFQTVRKETITAGVKGISEGVPAQFRYSTQAVANRANAFCAEKGIEDLQKHEEVSLGEHTTTLVAEKLATKLTMLGVNSMTSLPQPAKEWLENQTLEVTKSMIKPHSKKKVYTTMDQLPNEIEKTYTQPCKDILEKTNHRIRSHIETTEYVALHHLKERYEEKHKQLIEEEKRKKALYSFITKKSSILNNKKF